MWKRRVGRSSWRLPQRMLSSLAFYGSLGTRPTASGVRLETRPTAFGVHVCALVVLKENDPLEMAAAAGCTRVAVALPLN